MRRVIVEVDGGVAEVSQKPDDTEVVIFDWDDIFEEANDEECVEIQRLLWNGQTEEAIQKRNELFDRARR